MAETSRPWQGTTIGDAGPYSANDWQTTWEQMFNGANNRGVLFGIDEELQVTQTTVASNQIVVNTGAAIVQGIWYYNDADTNLSIATNASGSTRIDIIILEANWTNQTVRVSKVQGTPGSGVPALTQTSGVLWQMPLAYVTAASGFVTITNANITDWREYANIPPVFAIPVSNVSASVLESGSVCIWSGTAQSVTTSTSLAGGRNVAGVIERRALATSGAGRVVVSGIYPVIVSAAVAIGDLLIHSTTAARAVAMTSNQRSLYAPFARALTAQGTAGQRCLAYINVPVEQRGTTMFATGSYTGNAAPTQAITGIGFQPRYVQIWDTVDASGTDSFFKSELDGLNARYMTTVPSSRYLTDFIISLDADGFTIGDGTTDSNRINTNLRVYRFVAWG